jgi:hypothetical protein
MELSDPDWEQWLEGYMALHGVSSVVLADEDSAEVIIEVGDVSALSQEGVSDGSP